MKIQLRLLALPLACAASALAAVDASQLEAARALLHEPNKSDEARQAFEKIVASDPACAAAHRALVEIAFQRNDADQAIAHAEKAVTLDPENADYQHALGDAYGFAAKRAGIMSLRTPGLAKKCLAAFQRAAALAPDNPNYHQSLFEFYLQAPSLLGGGSDKARVEAAAIMKLDSLRGHLAFAKLYAEEKQYDLVLAEFDAALIESPDNYIALYQIGRYSAETGQFLDRGLSSLRRCLALTPPHGAASHAAVHCRIGNILEKKNDPSNARTAYKTALKIDPRFTAAADALKRLN